jgi:hypothetical protein
MGEKGFSGKDAPGICSKVDTSNNGPFEFSIKNGIYSTFEGIHGRMIATAQDIAGSAELELAGYATGNNRGKSPHHPGSRKRLESGLGNGLDMFLAGWSVGRVILAGFFGF